MRDMFTHIGIPKKHEIGSHNTWTKDQWCVCVRPRWWWPPQFLFTLLQSLWVHKCITSVGFKVLCVDHSLFITVVYLEFLRWWNHSGDCRLHPVAEGCYVRRSLFLLHWSLLKSGNAFIDFSIYGSQHYFLEECYFWQIASILRQIFKTLMGVNLNSICQH